MASPRGGMMSVFSNFHLNDPPGPPFRPGEPVYKDAKFSAVLYTTDAAAAARVLPPPLEAVPSPQVAIIAADYPHWQGWDGGNHPYTEFMVWVECTYRGERGWSIPYIYVGPHNGDYTDGAEAALCAGRESGGFPKKLMDIRIEDDGRACRATGERRGKRLIRLEAAFDRAIPPEDSPLAGPGRYFMVKEVLKGDFSGFDIRQVWAQTTGYLSNAKQARLGSGTVELGHLPDDPLDILSVVEQGPAAEIVCDIGGAGGDKLYLVADLLAAAAPEAARR